MKKRCAHIILSLLMLLVFASGQAIVYGHHHALLSPSFHTGLKYKQAVAKPKCAICDQNSHIQLFWQADAPLWHIEQIYASYQVYTLVYQSIKLLLSGNRGPPAGY